MNGIGSRHGLAYRAPETADTTSGTAPATPTAATPGTADAPAAAPAAKRGPGRPKGSKNGAVGRPTGTNPVGSLGAPGVKNAGNKKPRPDVPKPGAKPAEVKAPAGPPYMTDKDAGDVAECILSMTTPAYNGAFGLWKRPPLMPEEEKRQRDAWAKYAIMRGDPLGDWAPEIMLVSGLMFPILARFRPPENAPVEETREASAFTG